MSFCWLDLGMKFENLLTLLCNFQGHNKLFFVSDLTHSSFKWCLWIFARPGSNFERFYIDNSLTRLNSIQESEKFIAKSKPISAFGHFNLFKDWRSNLLQAVIDEAGDKLKYAAILGLVWDLKVFNLKNRRKKIIGLFVKRKILLVTQEIFDLIRFTAPESW